MLVADVMVNSYAEVYSKVFPWNALVGMQRRKGHFLYIGVRMINLPLVPNCLILSASFMDSMII